MTFKVGDKVQFVFPESCNSAKPGEIYTVQQIGKDLGVGNDIRQLCSCQQKWSLVKSNIGDKLGISSLTALGILGLLGYAVFKKESKPNGK